MVVESVGILDDLTIMFTVEDEDIKNCGRYKLNV